MTDPANILQDIQSRLTTATPAQIIEQLLPFTQTDAL